MTRVTATEAARAFSELLTRVAGGEQIEVTRAGADVAVISPPKARMMSAERFRELVATAPRPDADFREDVRRARHSIGPPQDPWAS